MSGLFDRSGINTGGSGELFPDAQYSSEGSGSGSGQITLIPQGDILIDGGTVSRTGSSFIISNTNDDDTTYTIRVNSAGNIELVDDSDTVISTVSFSGNGPVVIDRDSNGNIEIDVQVAPNTGNTATVALDTLDIGSTTYRVGGSTPAHARLRTLPNLSLIHI